MLEPVNLRLDRRIDARIYMTEEIRPPGTHNVQVFPAVYVIEPDTFAALNDHRRKLLIILHLSAGVPNARKVARLPRIRRQIRMLFLHPIHSSFYS